MGADRFFSELFGCLSGLINNLAVVNQADWNETINDNNAFTCRQCQPGHECKLGDEREDICPAGTASNDDRTMCVPCAAGEFSSAPGAASCQGIDSCSDVKSLLPRASDGEYTFRPFPTNKDVSLRIFCYNMASGNPKEFLSLPSGPNENFAHVYPYRLLTAEQCNGLTTRDYDYAGTTKFSKLRIKFDKSRIEVIRDDYTFARTTDGRDIKFGHAGDCYSALQGCAKGKFKVNLTGTKLKLANVEWKLNEHWPQNLQISHMTKSDDGKIASARCGGYCATCDPVGGKIYLIHDCHFPFTYEGKTYNSCTNVNHGHGRPWCSVTAVYQGKWIHCDAGP
ncbi:A disintegrin and metalloproteinase with thrombospondin motifs 9-like [Branchiostoma floridae x Branchiostoma belcheri]